MYNYSKGARGLSV